MTDLGESKAVPERWRTHYEFLGKANDNCLDVQEGRKLIEELGIQEGVTRMAVGCQERAVAKVRDLEEQLAVAKAGSIFTELLDEMDEEAENDPEFNDRIAAENDAMVEKAESTLAQQEATIREQAQTIERLTSEIDIIKQIESSTLPCGHHYRNGVTADGGKTGHCIMCDQAATIERLTKICCGALCLQCAKGSPVIINSAGYYSHQEEGNHCNANRIRKAIAAAALEPKP